MEEIKNPVYVAADPLQPGAAWAICVDKPKYAKDTAKSISEWIKEGANIMRVDADTGVAMLKKWVKPKRAASAESQPAINQQAKVPPLETAHA